MSQAFDRVWTTGLLHKVSAYLSKQHTEILTSYLTERSFYVYFEEAKSSTKPIRAGVPQGSVLGPLLYLLYTADIPKPRNVMVATFADDTALLAPHEEYSTAVTMLQQALTEIDIWTRRWKIRLNAGKTVRIDFTLRSAPYEPIAIGDTVVQKEESARYLGIHLDSKLNWRTHISKKRVELKLRFRALHWMLRAKSKLSLGNKRLLYQMLLRPIWTYGAPL